MPTVKVCAAGKQVVRQTINIANKRVFMAAESIGAMLRKVEQGRRSFDLIHFRLCGGTSFLSKGACAI